MSAGTAEDTDPFLSVQAAQVRLSGEEGGTRRWVALDATSAMAGPALAGFRQARLPGAGFFDIEAISDPQSSLPHMLPPPAAFARAMTALGVGADDGLIVYEQTPVFSAPRVWWTLRVMKHRGPVRILDGGLRAWADAGLPLEAGEPDPVVKNENEAAPYPEPAPDRDLVAGAQAVLAACREGGLVIDVRAQARYQGAAPEARPGLRSGHMPGAFNLPFAGLLNEQGRLRDREALRALLAPLVDASERRAPGQARVLASCGSGMTACILVSALARIGFETCAVYDGSWAEWGGDVSLPVVSGPGLTLDDLRAEQGAPRRA